MPKSSISTKSSRHSGSQNNIFFCIHNRHSTNSSTRSCTTALCHFTWLCLTPVFFTPCHDHAHTSLSMSLFLCLSPYSCFSLCHFACRCPIPFLFTYCPFRKQLTEHNWLSTTNIIMFFSNAHNRVAIDLIQLSEDITTSLKHTRNHQLSEDITTSLKHTRNHQYY